MIKVCIVEDDEFFAQMLSKSLSEWNDIDTHIFNNATDFLNFIAEGPDIVIADYDLPDKNGLELLSEIRNFDKSINCIVVSGQKDLEVVVGSYKLGIKNYIIKNENTFIELNNSIKNLRATIDLKKEVISLKSVLIDRNKYSRIIGESPAIINVLKLTKQVQDTKMLVLITGESGTGKELIAKAIHYNSVRKRKPFVMLNIAAIPEDLIESELFGHEKGAFTGAGSKRIGKFEEADGGTIFLDEIGEMDLNTQVKLLRVLQESKVTRLGSNKEIKLNVRVIVATNRNLSQLVTQEKFRKDLYYRLQGFLINLPPLRYRKNDIILLSNHFLSQFCKGNKLEEKRLSKNAIKPLLEYSWPGNIRELKALIERAVLVTEGDTIEDQHLIFSEPVF